MPTTLHPDAFPTTATGAADLGVAVLEPASLRLVACSTEFEQLTGRCASELRGVALDQALAGLVDASELRRVLTAQCATSVRLTVHRGETERAVDLTVRPVRAGDRPALRTEWRSAGRSADEPGTSAALPPSGEDSTLVRVLLEETADVTGKPFLDVLVRQLALALRVEYVLVTGFHDAARTSVRAISFWSDGEFVDGLVYELPPTPCQDTITRGTHIVPSDLQLHYPNDTDLGELGVNSYAGVTVRRSGGEVLGHLCCLGARELEDGPRLVEVLRYFAQRAGAELERIEREERLHEALSSREALIDLLRIPLDTDHLGERLDRSVEVLAGVPYRSSRTPVGIYLFDESRSSAILAAHRGLEALERDHVSDPVRSWLEERHEHLDATSGLDEQERLVVDGELGLLQVAPIRVEGELVGALVRAASEGHDDSSAGRAFLAGAAEVLASHLARERNRESLAQAEQRTMHSHRLEALGQLAGGIAHDFNNLLTAIHGNAELLDEAVPERSEVHAILHAAESASRLTSQLLAFTRRQVLNTARTDVGRVVEDVAEMLARIIPENITLDVETEAGRYFTLADSGQLEQVLINLVVNARDAMPEGGRLGVRTTLVRRSPPRASGGGEPNATARPEICIAVSDSGVGIEPSALERVFEPFYSTKQRSEGTGLGLSVVYGIVEQHGGCVDVSSQPGVGTEFRVYLVPCVAEQEPEPALPAGSGVREETDERGHVLVVEDEPSVREIAQRLLAFLGYEVTTSTGGSPALELFEDPDFAPDVVLLDVVMPGWSGLETFDHLRRVRGGQRVVFMTGHDPTAGLERLLGAKGVALLHKPFSLAELAAALDRVQARNAPGARS